MLNAQIETLARETMQTFEVPGLVVLVKGGDTAPKALVLGADAKGKPLARDSCFNVASITKLATALTVLRLVDANRIELADPLARFFPDARAAHQGVTLRTLLCHTAGLPQDLPNEHELYGTPMTWQDLGRECLQVELAMPPRTRVLYSNVGYGALAMVVEKVTQKPFREALNESVLQPLGIKGYLGEEPPHAPVKLADVRSRHVGTDIEPYNSRYYRSLGLPWSGMITNVDGALKLVQAFAGYPADFLSGPLRIEAISNQTGNLPGGYGARFDYPRAPWGLGPDLRGDKKLHWTPPNASPRTFGHAGASGCVVWHDPEKNISWVIAGSRTAENAWLVRGASKIAEAVLESGD